MKIIKILLITLGLFLIIFSISSMWEYFWDYSILSDFGKGFIWGNIIVLLLGIGIFFFGILWKKKKNN